MTEKKGNNFYAMKTPYSFTLEEGRYYNGDPIAHYRAKGLLEEERSMSEITGEDFREGMTAYEIAALQRRQKASEEINRYLNIAHELAFNDKQCAQIICIWADQLRKENDLL